MNSSFLYGDSLVTKYVFREEIYRREERRYTDERRGDIQTRGEEIYRRKERRYTDARRGDIQTRGEKIYRREERRYTDEIVIEN